MQRVQKRIAIDAMLAAGIVHRVIARDRAADAAHPELEEHADRLRRAAHHIVNQIVEFNGHARLHPELNGNAIWLRDSLSRRNLLGILLAGTLDRAAVELLRTIEMGVEGGSDAANQEP